MDLFRQAAESRIGFTIGRHPAGSACVLFGALGFFTSSPREAVLVSAAYALGLFIATCIAHVAIFDAREP